MNKEQKKYAVSRVDILVSTKLNEARNKYTIPERSLKTEEKVALVNSGKVKAIVSRYGNGIDFDFSKFERNQEFDREKFEVISAKVHAIATKAKDKIMLGDDCDTAMKFLAELESITI